MWIIGLFILFLVLVMLYRRMDTVDDMQKREHNAWTSMRYKHDSKHYKK